MHFRLHFSLTMMGFSSVMILPFMPCDILEKLLSQDHIVSVFTSCDDLLKKKQFCYILARHGKYLKLDDYMCQDSHDRILLSDIINNATLSESYLTLARDVEVMEPKSPEDIYKVHLLDDRAIAGASVDSARQNLAVTFVNAFVNAGFGQDKLVTVPADSSNGGSYGNWVFKNKEHGKISAAASLGMILLWDTDIGLAQIDKFIHSNDNYVIAGALLGVGLVNCNVYSHLDPARGILHEYIDNEDSSIRIGAIMGLGIAYAVPLALGLLCMSNPKVQIAQGLVHLGKGLLTLDPYHCDHFLLSPTALAGLVTMLHACLDLKEIILGKYHFVLYFLVLAIQPRMLMTLDENLKPLSVPVRVGQAVDIAGKAGQHKTITGFQTFTTPVLLAAGQRAELATEKYIPLTPTLEGHVILIENPEYRGDN
ncbi:hypothetical protein V6N11_084318 [Hibiscus sabdariffa]|uniref:26S proteasome non-ATPase regulatory subunit 2 homolog n=1 Tax=Hibiscus sabdariffa TaxID=183260 RepID=A0ABR2QSZ1_9ROSI